MMWDLSSEQTLLDVRATQKWLLLLKVSSNLRHGAGFPPGSGSRWHPSEGLGLDWIAASIPAYVLFRSHIWRAKDMDSIALVAQL